MWWWCLCVLASAAGPQGENGDTGLGLKGQDVPREGVTGWGPPGKPSARFRETLGAVLGGSESPQARGPPGGGGVGGRWVVRPHVFSPPPPGKCKSTNCCWQGLTSLYHGFDFLTLLILHVGVAQENPPCFGAGIKPLILLVLIAFSRLLLIYLFSESLIPPGLHMSTISPGIWNNSSIACVLECLFEGNSGERSDILWRSLCASVSW